MLRAVEVQEPSMKKESLIISQTRFQLTITFIQFGHNDSATSYKDRYVPLGNPDENGVYPKTEPSDGQSGTYKWYLQQYIDTAKKAGARPVLISPVSRLYYDAEGNIRPHHDSDDEANKSNTYVTAMKQLADENDVLFIDAFDMTKDMYEEAYKANVTTKPDRNAYYAMGTLTEKTHSGKMGGFMEAGLIARQIQNMDLDISKAVKAPEKVASYLLNGQTAYSVDADKNSQPMDLRMTAALSSISIGLIMDRL